MTDKIVPPLRRFNIASWCVVHSSSIVDEDVNLANGGLGSVPEFFDRIFRAQVRGVNKDFQATSGNLDLSRNVVQNVCFTASEDNTCRPCYRPSFCYSLRAICRLVSHVMSAEFTGAVARCR